TAEQEQLEHLFKMTDDRRLRDRCQAVLMASRGRKRKTIAQDLAHSTRFSGGVWYRSSKASGGEDLQVEEPVACRGCSSFHFHSTLARVLRPALIGDEVVQVGESREKRLLAPFGVMEAFHREQLPLDGIMGLIQ